MTETETTPPSSPASDWLRPVIFCVLMLPLVAGGVLLAIFFNMRSEEKRRSETAPQSAEQISIQAENTLLKKMLGQVTGQVAVLGPVEDGGTARGKIVWDEALQQGFLYVAHLPEPLAPGKAFFLWADSGDGKFQPCARLEPAPDGSIRRAFIPPLRVLKARSFILSMGDASGLKNPREKILVRGELDPRQP